MITLALVAILVACIEVGRRLRLRAHIDKTSSGLSVIDGAIFGLLGLLLAFAFSGADSRFEARRQLIVQETNNIGTFYLRIDLLPKEMQPQIQQDMRDYVDTRIRFYQTVNKDPKAAQASAQQTSALQQKIWKESVVAGKASDSPSVLPLVIGSLNDMIDITTTRSVALQTHPPLAIYILLLVLALASAFVAGYGMGDTGKRPLLHTVVYALALAITIYVIVDLEFPRAGLIRVDRYDQVLIDQRATMN